MQSKYMRKEGHEIILFSNDTPGIVNVRSVYFWHSLVFC